MHRGFLVILPRSEDGPTGVHSRLMGEATIRVVRGWMVE